MDQNVCRICLELPAIFNWNTEVIDFITYRDCYYKYTQMVEDDPLTQMLCEKCSKDLKNTHFLIRKALESYNILLQQSFVKIHEDDVIKVETDIDTVKFETVLFDQSLIECDDKEEKLLLQTIPDKSTKDKKRLKQKVKKTKVQKIKLEKYEDLPVDSEEFIDITQSLLNNNNSSSDDKILDSKKSRKKSIVMCQYCSKLISEDFIKRHEETHQEHRERTETCLICGVKLYNKNSLNVHMLIHRENRQKIKCEYCDNSYYNRGALNVHRRKHLGAMLACSICGKEYFRQVDLDKHSVSAHSSTFLSTDVKIKKKYVECKDCGKNIPSSRWKNHHFVHKNKFKMKCALCDKHFVTKRSCVQHLKRYHKKNTEDSNKLLINLGNDDQRWSSLLIEQTETVKTHIEINLKKV